VVDLQCLWEYEGEFVIGLCAGRGWGYWGCSGVVLAIVRDMCNA
jgi:hypothetical protein